MHKNLRIGALAGALALTGLLASCASGPMSHMMHAGQNVTLTGANEVPAVVTTASGSGTVTINTDRTVSAKIMASGMAATAAHIHEGAAGANGPVIVPFTKTGDNQFAAPEGAKLTESQYESFRSQAYETK